MENNRKMDDIYIPRDLDDCFVELNKIFTNEDIEKLKNEDEDYMVSYHNNLGRSLRNDWGLWGGSRLKSWFLIRGIEHADDMSGIILDSYWRHLNSEPIKLDEQIKHYQEYWSKMSEEIK